ncbi:MAG: Ig-like domain-containing protein, partial [Bacteroidota bacterium]
AVAISSANSVPTAEASVGDPGPEGVVAGTLSVSDPEGDTPAFATLTAPTKGTVAVDPRTGAFTYTPDAAARHAAAADGATADRSDVFTLAVTDGHGGTTNVQVAVAVSPANAAPVVTEATADLPNAGTGTVAGRVVATDGDGDRLSYYLFCKKRDILLYPTLHHFHSNFPTLHILSK